MIDPSPHRFCVAPMMDWTDRHCRAFHRVLTRRARLYTEMVTSAAIVHGDRGRLLGFSPVEHPLALQLGGSDPRELALAARIGEEFGYDEINLNIGCPSDRVQSGRFGACLMKEPELVGDCVAAMRNAVAIPVTMKCRIGVDNQDPEQSLFALVDMVAKAGCKTIVVHARKALLKGLSPKENREVPPLNHELVYRLKRERPSLTIILNGGVDSIGAAKTILKKVDGVMLGRAAYHDPWLLAQADEEIFGGGPRVSSPEMAVEAFMPYVAARIAEGVPLHAMTRHMLGLFAGRPGARAWRRFLSENTCRDGASERTITAALEHMRNRAPRLQTAA
jgi:tRNA-dihydrouridine synthase A